MLVKGEGKGQKLYCGSDSECILFVSVWMVDIDEFEAGWGQSLTSTVWKARGPGRVIQRKKLCEGNKSQLTDSGFSYFSYLTVWKKTENDNWTK